MFRTSIISKNGILKHVIGEVGFKNFMEIKLSKNYGNVRFLGRKVIPDVTKSPFFHRSSHIGAVACLRYTSTDGTFYFSCLLILW